MFLTLQKPDILASIKDMKETHEILASIKDMKETHENLFVPISNSRDSIVRINHHI